jgi:hypothetical protein
MNTKLNLTTFALTVCVAFFASTLIVVGQTASPAMKCTLTGKEVKTCCCEQQKNGKLFCKLAKKEVDKCCCTGM